ncbi:hypothetical protein HDU93_006241, partial [Gonapodya sp. JEL0774]
MIPRGQQPEFGVAPATQQVPFPLPTPTSGNHEHLRARIAELEQEVARYRSEKSAAVAEAEQRGKASEREQWKPKMEEERLKWEAEATTKASIQREQFERELRDRLAEVKAAHTDERTSLLSRLEAAAQQGEVVRVREFEVGKREEVVV